MDKSRSIQLLLIIAILFSFAACRTATINTGIKNTALFVHSRWQMQEIRFLYANKVYQYKRGVDSVSNINFDNDYIQFNKEGTGVYHETDGVAYPVTWQFDNRQKTSVTFVIEKFREEQSLVVHWEHLQISKSMLMYTEYYTHVDGSNVLGSGIRTSR